MTTFRLELLSDSGFGDDGQSPPSRRWKAKIPGWGILALMGETAFYSVPAMHCAHCERAVREELLSLHGVDTVDVDLDAKVVTVSGSALDDAAVRAAIVEAGYETD
jgi:copper chaperone